MKKRHLSLKEKKQKLFIQVVCGILLIALVVKDVVEAQVVHGFGTANAILFVLPQLIMPAICGIIGAFLTYLLTRYLRAHQSNSR